MSFWCKASHIVGGEITYKYISKASNEDVTYAVRLVLYMDCKNGNPTSIATDATAIISVFDAKTGAILKTLSKEVTRQSPVRVSAVAYKCIKNFPDVCVDMYIYDVNMVLPKRANGYILSFERCCRNTIIANINNPGSTGATYWTEIKPESVIGKNSSPVFKARPAIFLCLNAPFTFDHSAIDEDGDSLVYELTTPYYGASTNRNRPDPNNAGAGNPVFPLTGNRLVTWINPYSANDQMGGNPILEIDERTGRMTITPTSNGQFVVGIKVKEYRNGILIGETRRDYQFNVGDCVFDVVSVFYTAKTNCTNTGISFINQSSGAIRYHWDFGVIGITTDTSNIKSPTYLYSKAGTYKITLIAINSVCIDTFDYIVTIKDNIKVKLGRDTIICNPTTFKLDAGNAGSVFAWNSGPTTQTIDVTQSGVYIATVTSNPCVAKDTIGIIMDKSIFNAGKDTIQCNTAFIPFVYTVPNLYKTYLWNDNTTLNTLNITKPGKYWVTITNQNNCLRTDTIESKFSVPPKINLKDTIVCAGDSGMFNVNIKNYFYSWNTGETTAFITPNKAGFYKVNINNSLCYSSDSAKLSNYILDLEIGRDTFFCGPFQYDISTTSPFSSYLWNTGEYNRQILISKAGLVKVAVYNGAGCLATDSLFITNYPENFSTIKGDTVACTASILELTASDNKLYHWNTDETTPSIKIQDGGTYRVIVIDTNGCNDTVYHKVTKNPDALPNDIYMPNAFTPSGDKLNENYPDNGFNSIQAPYNLIIFNRWGEKLFEANSPIENWDGYYKGNLSQQGVYIYSLNYIGCDNNRHIINGEFNLIR